MTSVLRDLLHMIFEQSDVQYNFKILWIFNGLLDICTVLHNVKIW
jgi:hypothetical protein